jgi:histidinol-phosphate aminotransferase
MYTSRRTWLKQVGLATAGIGASSLETIAAPGNPFWDNTIDDKPVRLVANENPYGPSPLARKAMADHISISNRYNGELTGVLVAALAKKHQVTAGNILVGAGSTEILDIIARFSASQKGSFVIAQPTYDYWTYVVEKSGFRKIGVPLAADKKNDLQAMLSAVQPDTNLIYLCNPNNPTGTVCDRDILVTFVKEATKKAIVLVDEAYIDFTEQQSLCDLVPYNKNLVIAKTFSKIYGLAGARTGYAIAHKDTIEQLALMVSWPAGSLSVVSAAAAIASLGDEKFVKENYNLNQLTRKYTIEQLERLRLTCIPSNTNFVYFSLDNYKKDYFALLKQNNIIGTRIYEEQGKWTRITVGTMKEMKKFISAVA